MDALWQDLSFGVRMLRHNPLAMGLALLILAGGIGANTAIFSLVSGLLLSRSPSRGPSG